MASADPGGRVPVPRDRDDDYTRDAAAARSEFLRERTGAKLEHVGAYSFDPASLSGNVEQFVGVAQVPIGVAGPLLVNGEHAQGEFYVPLATAEGTLVASYNRGMRLLHEAGGVKTTIMADHMQRAPGVPLRERPRGARLRRVAGREHFDEIKAAAETTTSTGKLQEIERYSAGRILYTRFNYTTGDAAGQNLTGKATQAACRWILEQRPEIEHYFLESNFATDKKSSQINMLRTRGKRVVAEATIPNELFQRGHALRHRAHVPRAPGLEPRRLHVGRQQQRRALGQRDHGDVHRHRPGRRQRRRVLGRLRLRRAARQRRLLLLDHDPVADRRHLRRRHRAWRPSASASRCSAATATGKVRKLAEIIAATVLCGELSLGSAIVAEEWVEAHDLMGATARPRARHRASAPANRSARSDRPRRPAPRLLVDREDAEEAVRRPVDPEVGAGDQPLAVEDRQDVVPPRRLAFGT